MIAIFDAAYAADRAAAACVVAQFWEAGEPLRELSATQGGAAAYEPGQFYKRELPLLLAATPADMAIEYMVVDGYVWLGPDDQPGLGARFYEALGRRTPVIGVAKTRFAGAPAAEVLRGRSQRPLFVTAIGVERDLAADYVRRMHGPDRLPTLIKRADSLARRVLSE